MNADPYAWIEKDLDTIHRANWYRSPQSIESCPGPRVKLAGEWLINFASNDYLGLAGDDRLIQAAMAATREFGTGTTGSRLVGGHRDLHRQLERSIANLKQTEDALVFSSGYLANLGAIACLVGKRDLILSDKYNHSSLKNGATLSQAQTLEYAHCNVEDVRALLTEHRDRYGKCLIVTDSVFSMDGDLCPLPQLLDLAKQFNCMVLVDEAHATGVLGARGAGCVEHFGCTGESLIQVGTLSKALGSLGGYVAGDAAAIDFLRNRAPTWIYTTGLTPADTAAALEAVKIVQQEPDDRRRRLQENIKNFRDEAIAHYQLPITNSLSPIFSFPLKDAATALTASSKLKEMGIFAPAIRPPTVSVSRIRISLMATHEFAHLQHLAKALAQI